MEPSVYAATVGRAVAIDSLRNAHHLWMGDGGYISLGLPCTSDTFSSWLVDELLFRVAVASEVAASCLPRRDARIAELELFEAMYNKYRRFGGVAPKRMKVRCWVLARSDMQVRYDELGSLWPSDELRIDFGAFAVDHCRWVWPDTAVRPMVQLSIRLGFADAAISLRDSYRAAFF